MMTTKDGQAIKFNSDEVRDIYIPAVLDVPDWKLLTLKSLATFNDF